MSVEACLIRVTPPELKQLQDQPDSLDALIENLQEHSVFFNPNLDDPVERVLYVNEFTLSLLTELDNDSTPLAPLNRALIFGNHVLEGAAYGMGEVLFHTPEEVQVLARELSRLPESELRPRFESRAADFRLAAQGYLEGDDAILQHQQGHFKRLVEFYRGAAQEGDAMLVLAT